VAIAGDPGTKALCGKARTLKQTVDKNFGIDFGIYVDRSAHECASLEHQLSVSLNDIQLAVADPCISNNQLHCPSPNHAAGYLTSAASTYSPLAGTRHHCIGH
jgi:hypothetical protein